MDSLDVIKVCLRRWYVFLPLVLLAAGAGFGLSRQLKSSYTAIGSYAFVYTHPDAVRPDAPDPRNANPLIANGNAALLGEAVQASLNAGVMQERLGGSNRGYAPDESPIPTHYSVTLPPQSASYVVQTWADTPQAAAEVVQAVLRDASQSAKDAQERAGAPELSRYTTFITAPTQTTELPAQSPMKLLLTVLALGAVAGAAASLLVDRLLPRRAAAASRRRRRVTSKAQTHKARPRPIDATSRDASAAGAPQGASAPASSTPQNGAARARPASPRNGADQADRQTVTS